VKVLHVEMGRHVYGGARQVLYLQEHLPALGVDNILVATAGGDVAAQARTLPTKLIELPMSGDADIGFIQRLARVLRQERPNIIHVHCRRGADVYGVLAARLVGGAKVIISRRVDNAEYPFWARFKYSLYDHIVCVANGIKDVLVSEGVPAGKISVVHSAIDPSLYNRPRSREALNTEFGLHSDMPVMAIAAQLIPRKGHSLVFQAMEKLSNRYPLLQLLVFGRGKLENELKVEAKARGLNDRVRFAGFRPDLGDWLGAADFLVHPAYTEGLTNVALQAAAAGIPSIGTRVGGIPEAIADDMTGVLIPVGDVNALTEAIARFLDDKELRHRLGANGPAYVQQGFTADRMVEGNYQVYLSLPGQEYRP
jgi:glycosyltransferase involved in cell wall biosynthesis